MEKINETKVKQAEYLLLEKQVEAILDNETNLIANLANVCAILKEAKSFFWVGFYLFQENELILGPFQGPVACTRIAPNKGVCGHAFSRKETTNVPNVHNFEGHIACSALSNSELVIPMIKNDICYGVLDIDSQDFNAFDTLDCHHLERIVACVTNHCF